jgi:hypothetical protein
MTSVEYYGKQQVDWMEFNRVVICVGFFISVLTGLIWGLIGIGGGNPDTFFFVYLMIFGIGLMIEGMVASFFKVN